MGEVVVALKQGDIWWGEAPDERGRPYLVLTRDVALPVLSRVLVAPVTRTMRGIPTEVPLGAEEGLPTECVATFDNLRTLHKSLLTRHVGMLDRGRRAEICAAMAATIDC